MLKGPYTISDVIAVFIGLVAVCIAFVIAYPFVFAFNKVIKPRLEARERIKAEKRILKKVVEEIEYERGLRRET